MSPEPIKIIQFSDPHLFADEAGSMYGLNTLHSFNMVLKDIARQAFDLAILSGDIAQDESEKSYRRLKSCLQELGRPVYMIPGNHDNISLMSSLFQAGDISCRKQVVAGKWQIILLNSQWEGRVEGRLLKNELVWLEQCLASHVTPYAIVCMHHQPVDVGCKWLDNIGLKNADALFDILAPYSQVKAVLWGHVHQAYDEERAGLRLISCPSTCIQFKPRVDDFALDVLPPGYRWLELYEDGTLKTGVNRLTDTPGEIDPAAKGY